MKTDVQNDLIRSLVSKEIRLYCKDYTHWWLILYKDYILHWKITVVKLVAITKFCFLTENFIGS